MVALGFIWQLDKANLCQGTRDIHKKSTGFLSPREGFCLCSCTSPGLRTQTGDQYTFPSGRKSKNVWYNHYWQKEPSQVFVHFLLITPILHSTCKCPIFLAGTTNQPPSATRLFLFFISQTKVSTSRKADSQREGHDAVFSKKKKRDLTDSPHCGQTKLLQNYWYHSPA